MSKKPLVLIPCDNRMLGEHPYHVLGQKYADAIRDAALCLPLLLPCTGQEDWDAYLEMVDGIFLTGSPANVHPSLFGQEVHNPQLPLDPARDATTLSLIRRAVTLGLPILGVCRGLQEINVALGGSLLQAIHHVPGRIDHYAAGRVQGASAQDVYALAHKVHVVPDCQLATLVGQTEFTVNSVHDQGIDRLADGLVVQAHAPDGQIEAISLADYPGFSLAVQWHPEWQVLHNPVSMKIFTAFGDACRMQLQQRLTNNSMLPRAA